MKIITFLDLGTDSQQAEIGTAFAKWLQAKGERVCLTSLRANPELVANTAQYVMPWSDERLTYCLRDHVGATSMSVDWTVIDSTEALEYLRYFAFLVDTVVIPVGSQNDANTAAQLFDKRLVTTPLIGVLSGLDQIVTTLKSLPTLDGDGYNAWFAAIYDQPAGWFYEKIRN